MPAGMGAKTAVEAGTFTVGSVERKRVKRNPPPPFTTSTLQQEASRKFGFAPAHTMRIAQRLYEGIDIDAFIQSLRQTHGLLRAETQFPGSLLL